MRGDSYQLQGQGGGVVINDGEFVIGKFRSMLVLVSGNVSIEYANVVDTSNVPVAASMGVLDAGTVLNGVLTQVIIDGAGSKAICYYE